MSADAIILHTLAAKSRKKMIDTCNDVVKTISGLVKSYRITNLLQLAVPNVNHWWVGVIVPQPVEVVRIREAVVDDEAIPGHVRHTRINRPVPGLRRRVVEERLGGVNTHRLRGLEIIRMPEHGDAHRFALDHAADVAPPRARGVAVAAIFTL